MKLVLILCLVTSLQAIAVEGSAQNARVDIHMENAKIENILKEIEKQSDYRFFYDAKSVQLIEMANVTWNSVKVSDALSELFAQKGIAYRLIDKQIVLFPTSSPEIAAVAAQGITVTGTITEKGQPMPGVNVIVKGTTIGTITDISGHYSITVPDDKAVLQFTFVGYTPQDAEVGARTVVNMEMEEDTRELEEVVVVGYGVQKKVNLTGAVDQVTSEAFENRPITNISQALVGAVANLNIVMLDGKPTQSPSFNIRGTTSIGQGGSALVLIDEVEGDPRMLNPNDIESVSVLKDAASASIYGARAAFGVVLITTKSAASGKVSVNYSNNLSLKTPTTVPDNIVDSYPWAQSFSDSWARWNDNGNTPTAINKTMSFSQAYLAEIKRRWEDPTLSRSEINPTTGEYQYFYSTDWYKELYKNHSFAQDHNISMSGGNEMATFYISGRYNGEDGLYRYNTDNYEMYNLRAKGTIRLASWLELLNNTEFSKMTYHQPINVGEGSGIWRNMADEGHPLAPLFNPDGTISFSAAYTVGDHYYGRSGIDLDQRVLRNRTALKADFFNKSLTIRANFTFENRDNNSQQTRVQVPYSRYKGVIGYTGTGTNDLQEGRQTRAYYVTNIYAEYVKSLNDAHNFKFLAGQTYEHSVSKSLTVQRNGLVYEDAKDINFALGQTITTPGGQEKWEVAGVYFRVNYNFKERYLLEVNGRYDGSSKFPINQKWAFFPSVSAGWRLSEEPFWDVSPMILSNVKIRASYGSLGNGNIAAYSFYENFGISQSGRIINGIRPQRTSQPGVVPDGLTWETATTGNIGLDFATLDNRLRFYGDLYRRWTKDMFTVGPSLPALYGTSVPKGNYADLETTGWEISVSWIDQFKMAGKPFNYDVRFSVADSKAIITKYNNDEKNLSDYYVGQKVGEIWGYQVDGLFKSTQEIASSPSQVNIPNTNTKKNYVGDIKFKNLDGDNVIYQGLNRVGDSGDKSIIGNSSPRFTYGLNLSGDWNGFFLSAFFQGVMHQDYYPSREARFWGQYNRPYNSYPRWQENNMFREELGNFDAYLPRLVSYIAQGTGRALAVPNDRFLQNASYIRLRNLQIGYYLPTNLVSKFHAKSLRIFLSAENVWTWSPMYKWTKDTDVTSIYGSDRDLGGGTSGDGYNYPMLKAFSIGLSVNF